MGGRKTGLERRGQRNHGPNLTVVPHQHGPHSSRRPTGGSWWTDKSREELNAEAHRRFAATPLWYLPISKEWTEG